MLMCCLILMYIKWCIKILRYMCIEDMCELKKKDERDTLFKILDA